MRFDSGEKTVAMCTVFGLISPLKLTLTIFFVSAGKNVSEAIESTDLDLSSRR